ncbi:MAG: ABC transporter ATP-binding protein [Rhodanobacteraceae bacterium]
MNAPLDAQRPLVEVRGIGKSYPKVHRSSDRLRALGRLLFGRNDPERVSVLRNIDLEVRRGESLGLIGENGAGKSTLLKLVTGVLTPSSGSVAVHGDIGALLELGAGFHPEYSGRDNVAMAMALHGFGTEELRERLPRIIEFADIGDYVDEPVKHYSSGMVVRLGFAVVAALKPDLLITDEVLAVGDESFQKKCIKWMEGYLGDGGTLMLVSHSMYHVQKLCRRACWLRAGEMAMAGDVFDVTQAYLAYHERKTSTHRVRTAPDDPGLEFSLLGVELNGEDTSQPLPLDIGDTLRVRVTVRSREGRIPTLVVGIVRADGTAVYGVSTEMDSHQLDRTHANTYVGEIEFPALCLLPGSYVVKAHPLDTEGMRLFDTLERDFTIRGESREFGLIRLAHRWRGSSDETGP